MSTPSDLETDPRFPSGKWLGFFLQKEFPPGKHQMELLLTFRDGILIGEGRDVVGLFTVQGRYHISDGRCHWTKQVVGKHFILYSGFNEGKGIWGSWEIPPEENNGTRLHGGFHIWPEEMGDPTSSHLHEEADAAAEAELTAV